MRFGIRTNPKRCGDEKHRAYCHPSHFPGARDVLYRNNGDGTFTDITRIAGVDGLKGKGLGIGLWDFDDDGFLDVYIANDTEMNLLYHNKGDGSFRDISLQSWASSSRWPTTPFRPEIGALPKDAIDELEQRVRAILSL
jgi:FG-GAP-like repeat